MRACVRACIGCECVPACALLRRAVRAAAAEKPVRCCCLLLLAAAPAAAPGHLAAGAVAGAASRSATAPLETLRLAAMAGAAAAGVWQERCTWLLSAEPAACSSQIASAPGLALHMHAPTRARARAAGTLPPGTSLLAAGRQMVGAGGVAALYRGNLVNVLRSAPARAVDFFAFDV